MAIEGVSPVDIPQELLSQFLDLLKVLMTEIILAAECAHKTGVG